MYALFMGELYAWFVVGKYADASHRLDQASPVLLLVLADSAASSHRIPANA